MRKNKGTGRSLATIVIALVAAFSCSVFLGGCKSSDVLTELLFDQNAPQVDEDNPSKFLHNMLDALDMTKTLPQLQKQQVDLERERVDEDTVQGEDTVNDEAPSFTYQQDADPIATTEEAGDAQTEASTEEAGEKKGESSKGKGKSKKKGMDKKPGSGGDGDGAGDGDGKVYHGNGGTGKVYNEGGSYDELPENVQAVVAFGECANMVVSFAGEHALMGADASFLKNSFIKKAYAKKDIANAKKISISDKNVIDAAKVAELKPDAVLVMNNSYKFDDAGLKKLKDADVDVVYLPAMDSAKHIKTVATSIGSMFGGADNTLSGDDAEAAATAYVDWHDKIVDAVKARHDGLAGSVNFETGEDIAGSTERYTIYLHEWDNATYTATPDDAKIWTDGNGVGITKAGYKWSPMSYYLSVGGTENLSATFKSSFYSTTAKYYIWQFNLGRVPAVYDKNWSGRSVSVSKLRNSGTADMIVKVKDGPALGAKNFSYVIARTRTAANALETSRDVGTKKQQGLYAVYKTVKGSDGTGTGFLSKTGDYCSAAIQGDYDVIVNPHGLYSSWIDGSPESALEAVWAEDVNKGSSRLESAMKEYYKLFYGVDLSSKQVSTITSGQK